MVGTSSIGIVGLGSIGRYHAEHLRALAPESSVALAGGMDIAAQARERFEEAFGVSTYETHEALYDRIDAAIITTPNRFHEEYAVSALEAGLDVLIEKPIAHTVESAECVVTAAQDSAGSCMVGFHNRFAQPVEVLMEYLREGRFGEIYHIEADYVRRRGVPGRGSWFTQQSAAGGGALIDIGAHAIDLALYILGFPQVSDVSGVTRSVFGGRSDYTYLDMHGDSGDGAFDVDDSASAFLRCSDGSTISLDVAWAANRPPKTEFVIRGEEAGARLDLIDGDLTIFETDPIGAPHFSDSEITTRDENAHRNEQRRFIETVASDEPLTVNTSEQALVVQRVMDAIYRSSDTGASVDLDERPVLAVE